MFLVGHGLDGLRAAVRLGVAHSGSTKPCCRDGSVQALADRVLGPSAHLGGGTVPVVFSTDVAAGTEIAPAGHEGRVECVVAGPGHLGRTRRRLAMDAVTDRPATGRRRTEGSSASTAPCRANGPACGPTPTTPNAPEPPNRSRGSGSGSRVPRTSRGPSAGACRRPLPGRPLTGGPGRSRVVADAPGPGPAGRRGQVVPSGRGTARQQRTKSWTTGSPSSAGSQATPTLLGPTPVTGR